MKYQNFLPRFITKRINKYQKEKAIQKARNDYNNKIAEFLKSSYVGVQEQNNSLELIVSLTSYPARIPYIKYTLYTLLMQSYKPNQILLWLSKEEFPNKEKDLPQELLEFVNNETIKEALSLCIGKNTGAMFDSSHNIIGGNMTDKALLKFLGEDCSVSGRISGAPRVTVISVLHWGQVVSCPSHSSSASSLALQFGHLK